MFSQILLPIAATFLCYGLLHVVQLLYHELTSPLRNVTGPRNPSFILGNLKEMMDDASLPAQWRSEFGRTFRFKGLFSISELHSSDIKAVNHIISKSAIYRRAPSTRDFVKRLVGSGLLTLELDEHKRQVIMVQNQAFGVAQIRLLTDVFIDKGVQLRDIWAQKIEQQNGAATIDVLEWLRRTTLDVIGQAGFDYEFDALHERGQSNELNTAFSELLHSPEAQRNAIFRRAQSIIPFLKLLPVPGTRNLKKTRDTMKSIARQIISTSKASLMASQEEKTDGKRDVLSVLLKANLSSDLPESQRLSDAEVIAQIPTFLFAGHETTSASLSWALHALSQKPAVQSKLRDELFTLSTENPTMDELNSLAYLESVVRETMRVHAPVMHTQRMAMQDDVLPLSKPYIDKHGKSHDSLPIPKGQVMHIPILAVNTETEIWGDDAGEFIPERWEHIPEAVSSIPGVWANLFSFFAGPDNCIGFRFSLLEMKVLLFMLIRTFEFEPGTPKGSIVPKAVGLVYKPSVLGDEKGSGLPLIVKPYDTQQY
ncbi:cytochrome P450 [Mycena galericulata]|nr:cytochrome P450 [Mycena galericulata]